MKKSKSRFSCDEYTFLFLEINYSSSLYAAFCMSGVFWALNTWGDLLRSSTKEFTSKFKFERKSFISILNFNNFILVSMPRFYLFF